MRRYILLFYLVMAVCSSAPAQQGSTLLFSDWVSARVESRNPFFANDSLLFNFDKWGQVLLATADKKDVLKIDRKEFQRVTFSLHGIDYIFEHVPVINDKDLFQVLVEDSGHYCLYKFIHLNMRYTVVRGLITNRYYLEDYTYYIVFPFPDMRVTKLVRWDKKLLKRAFVLSGDSGKVDAFYTAHNELQPGEEFLVGLVTYLDQ